MPNADNDRAIELIRGYFTQLVDDAAKALAQAQANLDREQARLAGWDSDRHIDAIAGADRDLNARWVIGHMQTLHTTAMKNAAPLLGGRATPENLRIADQAGADVETVRAWLVANGYDVADPDDARPRRSKRGQREQ